MYIWTIDYDDGHIDTRDIYRRREELHCIELNVNHHNEYAYMWICIYVDVSCEHAFFKIAFPP